MGERAYRTYQTLIAGGLGLLLLFKIYDGQILLYINRRFVILVLMAAFMLLAVAQLLLRQRGDTEEPDMVESAGLDHGHVHGDGRRMERSPWNLFWLSIPLILGLIVPARPLGGSAAAVRGVSASVPLSFRVNASDTAILTLPPEQRSILDWLMAFEESSDLSLLAGQRVDVTGFVFKDPRLPADRFLVGRFMVTCCVADAQAVGMVVEARSPVGLSADGWVRVRGVLQVAIEAGREAPYVLADLVEPAPEPQLPYLYP